MKLEDYDRKAMIKAAENLAYCLKEGADEDAWAWIMQLTFSLHQDVVKKWAKLKMAIDDLGKK